MNHGKNIQERSELDQTMPPPLKSPEPEPPDKKLYSSAKSFLPFQPHFFMAIAFLYMVTAVIEGGSQINMAPYAGSWGICTYSHNKTCSAFARNAQTTGQSPWLTPSPASVSLLRI